MVGTVLFSLLGLVPASSLAQPPESFSEFTQESIIHDDELIIIENVRVIDGSGSAALESQNITIRNGIIESVSSQLVEGPGVRIDGTGKTVIPGLIMFHEHLLYNNATVNVPNYTSEALAMPPLYLAGGATTIRTAGTMDGHHDIQIKSWIDEGRWPGPDIYITAPYIEGPDGFAYQMPVFEEPELVRQFVRYWTSMGATSFKVYNEVSRAVLAAAIDEAHSLGVTVTGHLCSITYEEASNLGIDNLEHGLIAATDLLANKTPGECPTYQLADLVESMRPDNPELTQLIELLVENNTAITSTLPVFAAGIHPSIPTQEALDLLSPRSKDAMQSFWIRFLENPESDLQALLRERLELEMAFEKAFVEAGGTLLIGTDPTGWGGTIPPNSTHAALILLVEAGFSPIDAIQLATLNGAYYLGIEDETGSIEAGKQADLVLINGRPDVNIHDIQNVEEVFKDGVGYDPEALMNSVRGTLGR